jgi:cell division protein FtsL
MANDLNRFRPLSAAKQRRQRFPWYFDMNSAGVLVVGVVLVSLVSLLYLIQTSRIATTGYELAQLEQQHDQLLQEQQELQFIVSQYQNLGRIETLAKDKLGMVRPMKYRYLSVSLPSVAQPAETAVTDANAATDGIGNELWRELSAQYAAALHSQSP